MAQRRRFVRRAIDGLSSHDGGELNALFIEDQARATAVVKDLIATTKIHHRVFSHGYNNLFDAAGRPLPKWLEQKKPSFQQPPPNPKPAKENILPGAVSNSILQEAQVYIGAKLTLGTEFYRVARLLSQEDDSRTFILQSQQGVDALVLRISGAQDYASHKSFEKESARLAHARKMGINTINVRATGMNYIVKDIPFGVRGDQWLEENPKGTVVYRAGMKKLEKMFIRMIVEGSYVGELTPKNLYWNGAEWFIMKAGGIDTDLSANEVYERIANKIPKRWGIQMHEMTELPNYITVACKKVFGAG